MEYIREVELKGALIIESPEDSGTSWRPPGDLPDEVRCAFGVETS